MDRGELLEAVDELQGRLDVMPEGIVEDDVYDSLCDALDTFKDLLGRRKL